MIGDESDAPQRLWQNSPGLAMAIAPFAWVVLSATLLLAQCAQAAVDLTRQDNLAVYWGQDSAGDQQPLSTYCNDATIDIIPIAFLYSFVGEGNAPMIDLSNICSKSGNQVFAETALADCSFMADEIKACQANGKAITLSLGGADAQVGFASADQATAFANQIWDMFLGGNSDMRPFGDAVLDGIDLDIESGSAEFYAVFANTIKGNARWTDKSYFISAAPQCPFPDAHIGGALSVTPFDAIYVQFYNNDCGLNHPSDYNFATWDSWARTTFPHSMPKIFIGAPASPGAAGQGYVPISTLQTFVEDAMDNFPDTFGGVMLWDVSEARDNDNYDAATKTILTGASQARRAKREASSRMHSRSFRPT